MPAVVISWATTSRTWNVLCFSSPLSWHFSNACPPHILLMTALFSLMTSSWHYLCRSTKWLPTKLCLQCCSKCLTCSCILTQTVKVISYLPLQHPAKLPWHRLVHFSLCCAPLLIPTLTACSFLCPCLSCLSASFYGIYCTLPILDRVLCSRFPIASPLQHKPKLIPQSHLCNHPSTVPPEVWTCVL